MAFLLRGRPDTQLRATVKQPQQEAITLDLSISANAEFGGRQVQVTTPSGTGVSPADVEFRVAPGPLQVADHPARHRRTSSCIGLLRTAAATLHTRRPALRGPAGSHVSAAARPVQRPALAAVGADRVCRRERDLAGSSRRRSRRWSAFAARWSRGGAGDTGVLESQQPQWKDQAPARRRGCSPC